MEKPTQKEITTYKDDAFKEKSSLYVETHLKITDPQSKEQIVNTRG